MGAYHTHIVKNKISVLSSIGSKALWQTAWRFQTFASPFIPWSKTPVLLGVMKDELMKPPLPLQAAEAKSAVS